MRIQLLLLPLVEIDENRHDQPFALVVDQYDGATSEERLEQDAVAWGAFARECGARSIMVTPETVDVPAETCPPMALAELPEGSERTQIINLIKGYFAAVDDDLYDDVETLCGRIERGEHLPSKGADADV